MERHDVSQYTLQDSTTDPAPESIGAVREEAKEQVRSVADTAVQQTKGILADMGSDISTEAQSQKLRLAKGLDGFSTELEEVALNGSGRVPSLASEAAARTRSLSRWLERTDPSDIVRSVEDFGRRRPVMFILGSALAGVAAGRLTRGIIDDRPNAEDSGDRRIEVRSIDVRTHDSPDAAGVPSPGTPVGVGNTYGGVS